MVTPAWRELAASVSPLRDFSAPWAIAGGWALDLFLGRVTRPHQDVDVALFRADQRQLRRALEGWTLRKVVGGHLVDWPEAEWLRLPVHEIHAHSPGGARLEILLNERAEGQWLFRRDPAIRRPLRQVVLRSAADLPYLSPSIVLLFKARSPREIDHADFAAVVGELPPEETSWLRQALLRADPGHAWLGSL